MSRAKKPDGWYWVFEKPGDLHAVMYRLWTGHGKTPRQQTYRHGHTRLRPRCRDQLAEQGVWVVANPPGLSQRERW